ncbi:unnamed protein product, partial [Lymnaea stagnalis]
SLTTREKKIIRKVWDDLKANDDIEHVGVDAFMRVFKNVPQTLDFFMKFKYHTLDKLATSDTLKEHAASVTSFIELAIDNMDDAVTFSKILREEGKNHLKRQIPEIFMEEVTLSFRQAIEKNYTLHWKLSHSVAWRKFFEIFLLHFLDKSITP